MSTSIQDLREWFDRGVDKGATHMIVMVDGFDYEDYPVYVMPEQDVREVEKNSCTSMQRVMEVYKMSLGKDAQWLGAKPYIGPLGGNRVRNY